MKHIVGPYLCFTQNNPTRWLCILMDDDKVVSVESAAYFPQATKLNWSPVGQSGVNYIYDAHNEGTKQSFLLLIEDKHLYRVLKPQHDQVNAVERLQYNGTHPFWHVDPSHKAHNVTRPLPDHLTDFKLVQVQISEFPVIQTPHFESKLERLFSSIQKPTHFQKTLVDLPSAAAASTGFSIEQAFSLLTNPKCAVVGTPSLKLSHMTVYLCKCGESWKGAIKIGMQQIDITFSLDEFPELNAFLEQYNHIKTSLDITEPLKTHRLIPYVVSGYLKLSLYQQKLVVNFIELADIWPIQDSLTPEDQKGLLKLIFGFPEDVKLSDAAALQLDSIRECFKPDNLVRLEQKDRFYVIHDKYIAVAKKASLADVYNLACYLFCLAGEYLNLKSLPILVTPEGSEYLRIGEATTKAATESRLGLLSDQDDVFYRFFLKTDRAWDEYSMDQLRNFQEVAAGLIARNPQYATLSQFLLAAEHDRSVESGLEALDRLFVYIQTFIEHITLAMRLIEWSENVSSPLELGPLLEQIQSIEEFIIVFKCSAVSLYSDLYLSLKNKMDTYFRETDVQLLIKLLKALGREQKLAMIDAMEKDIFNYISNLDDFYCVLTCLPEVRLIPFLDKFQSNLASLPITWSEYFRVYRLIPYAAKLKFIKYTEEQTLHALSNHSQENVRLFISQLDEMELACWLSNVSISITQQLLRHFAISALLGVFEDDTRNLITKFVEVLEPHQVTLITKNFSLHELILDIDAPGRDVLVSDLCRLAEGNIYSKDAFYHLLEHVPSSHLPIFLINATLMSRFDHTTDELIYFLKKLDEASRLSFLRVLGERINRIIPRQCHFIEVAQCLPSSDLNEFLNLGGVRIKEFIPELWALTFVYEKLNPQSRSILLGLLVEHQFLYVSSPHINWCDVDMNSQIEILKTWLDLNEFRRALSNSAHARGAIFNIAEQHLYEKSLITHLQQLILFKTEIDQGERFRNYPNELCVLRERAITVYQDVCQQLEGLQASHRMFS